MAIKRLYQKLTDDENSVGFDSETARERRREIELKGQRLQFIVYSALFAFIVLAAYGYFLIYNLTHDVHNMSAQMNKMTLTFQRMTNTVEKNMESIAADVDDMSTTIHDTLPAMVGDTEQLGGNTRDMAASVNNLSERIATISQNLHLMTNATVNMQRDMWSMNKNVSDPFGTMFGNMMPWGGGGKTYGSPGPLPYRQLPAIK